MKDNLRKTHSLLLVFCGFLTLILSNIIEVAGGGASLIFIVTVPFFIGLGTVFGAINFYIIRSTTKRKIALPLLVCFYVSIVVGTLVMFPFK